MVRSGARPGQVLPSGRHTAPAKLNGKKGSQLRKVSRFNADSGNLVLSDSESQVETVQGLDGCASLLRDILRNEDSGSEAARLKNRCKFHPRTTEGQRYGSKKRGPGKHTVVSAVWKDILSSDNKQPLSNEASARNEKDSSDIAQNQSLQDHYRMYSPIIYQALCEHVQTQMSLMNDLASKNGPNGIPGIPCPTVSGSESQATPRSSYGLSTSTPVLSPQRPPCPPMVHSEVQTESDDQFTSEGGAVSVTSDVLRNSFNTSLGAPCSMPRADPPVIPGCQHLGHANGFLPQPAVSKEADLLKYFQTYMSLLHSHGKETHRDSQTQQSPKRCKPAFLATREENCVREHTGEDARESKDSNTRVREAKAVKDAQKAKNVNQTTERVRMIKYLLGELKALAADQGDSEIHRLVSEVEACVLLLPAVSGNTNIQVEIALAMQPLRSENAQLRRQVRMLNQQLREREKTQKTSSLECSLLKLFSLQSLNASLQNQLQESLQSQEFLQRRNEELLNVIENQTEENKKFATIFKEKDQSILENKQQFDIETTRMKIELEEAQVNLKSSQFKLEATEKENQILGITLRQRDAEVTRLRELTRTLQSSMAELLSDLSTDSARCKPGNNLTKSLLDTYEKQLQRDPSPPLTSVMSYLSQLETNHNFPHSEPHSAIKHEESTEPARPYENALPAEASQLSNTKNVEVGPAPGTVSAIWNEAADEENESKTLVEDESNLDETIYLPFVRSTPQKKSPLAKRQAAQPQVSVAAPQQLNNSGLLSEMENKPCASMACSSSQKDAEDVPEKLSRTTDMEDRQLLQKIQEAIGKIPAVTEPSLGQAVYNGPSAPQSGNLEKGNAVSDGSFLTSDLMSDWSLSSFSTYTSRDEQDFRNGLAALDANIARLQKSLRTGLLEK
ncbi:coiled-coil domain-containing protein 14 [Tenrec ecaudatus]|uniref:coiled-coil domain-containing protein 14 n=1 Tax=Tenrec ecaudatus TaxID=94439 RepID=UPI003F59D81F